MAMQIIVEATTYNSRFELVCDLVELPFRINFTISRKLKGH